MVVHTGDFKMDQLPLDNRLTDLHAFARLSEEGGIDLLLTDSTNAEVPRVHPARAGHLRRAAPGLRRARKRIIVASFASHVHRIQQILDAAYEYGRRVAFVGRSMVRNMGIARDLGYLKVPPGLVVDVKTLDDLPDHEVVLVCTGSQGEPMAALSRMANRDHQIRIVEGDTVILASSLIPPGNENAVYRVINGLTRWGANVVHKGNAKVHVSGHASAGELLYFYNICRPKNLMPVHGEWRHLRANAELGALTGVPHDRIVIAEDGVTVDLVEGKAKISGKVQAGYVYVDGLSVATSASPRSRTARSSGDEGIISVFVVVDSTTGKVTGGPHIQARGSGIEDSAFGEVMPKIAEALEKSAQEGIAESHQLQQLIRRTLGKWVSDTYRRRPMILPVVVEV